MAQLLNRADASGTFDSVPIDASTELSVELSALSITKTADKAIWVRDNLTYTIVVRNIDTRDPDDPDDPGLPVTGVEVTDTIDPTIAALVAGSVMINNNPAVEGTDYTYDPVSGLLTLISLDDLAVGGSHTITFQVSSV